MHDLLSEPLIGVITPEGPQRLSLPELLAALSANRIDGYTGLRAHQADPWHVFLVQLAASIQARAPTETLPTDATYWREGLLALADGQVSAWHLVEKDVTRPAFLQHPWQSWEKDAADYGIKKTRGEIVLNPKRLEHTPDGIDVLFTSKNHDVKMARIHEHFIEPWIYALVVSQTMAPYGGKKNYGISRMNSGSGSRPIIAWTTSLHPSRRFIDEVQLLCDNRSEVIKQHRYQPRGPVLTWLQYWKRGDHQWMITDLEPWFIEAARPRRLLLIEGALLAFSALTEKRQIGPKEPYTGDVGDPWIPLNVKSDGDTALTISESGFTPELVHRLLFRDNIRLTFLQEPRPSDGTAFFVGSVLVGGNCKTDGFHRFVLPVPPKARMALLRKESRATLGHLAQSLLTESKKVERAFTAALIVFGRGGPKLGDEDLKRELEKHERKSEKRDAVDRWIDGMRARFAKTWEASYFPTLWRGAEEPHETVRHDWQQELVNKAAALLDEASQRLPIPANRTWRAITRANNIFRAMLRKHSLPLPGAAHHFALDAQETIA